MQYLFLSSSKFPNFFYLQIFNNPFLAIKPIFNHFRPPSAAHAFMTGFVDLLSASLCVVQSSCYAKSLSVFTLYAFMV